MIQLSDVPTFFAAKAEGGDEEEADDDTDPYELLDPVDILDKLPKTFYEMVIIIFEMSQS